MASWPMAAAHVHDRSLTVVAANRLARALSPHYDVGSNTLRSLFLEPGMRDLYRNWDKLTAWTVRLVRAFVGHDPNPELLGLILELTKESDRFHHLWAHHEVKHDSSGLILISHPIAGPLDLHFQHLVLPGTGQTMVVYWADLASFRRRPTAPHRYLNTRERLLSPRCVMLVVDSCSATALFRIAG